MHADGKFCICWDPLDGSSIVDNNWAVGTIIGIWGAETGIIGATGRDQVTSMVALYGPRTTMFVALDDGLYEFTYGANGVDGWICSRERIKISEDSKIFSPGNLRAAQDVPKYGELVDFWMENKYTLRYSGGLVPDVCQQFTKKMGMPNRARTQTSSFPTRLEHALVWNLPLTRLSLALDRRLRQPHLQVVAGQDPPRLRGALHSNPNPNPYPNPNPNPTFCL